MTCTICGDPFEPLNPQARAMRTVCYSAECMRERQRQIDGRRRAEEKRLLGRAPYQRQSPCARCDQPAHEGKTCKEVAA